MSTWTHRPTCYPLGSLFDSISGVNCSLALFIWIRDPMTFDLAHIFPFLFQNNKTVLEGFWTTLDDHFQFSCKTYGKTHLHLQLIPWDCLTHSWHSRMKKPFQAVTFPTPVLHWPQLKSKLTERRVFDDPGHWDFQSRGVPLLTDASRGSPHSVKWGWGGGSTGVSVLCFLWEREKDQRE